jgi:multidrug resistance efflux pump
MNDESKKSEGKPEESAAEAGSSEASEASQTNADDDGRAQRDIVRRVTLIVVGLCVLIFVWKVIADRLTPSTSQARVRGFVVPIVPEVSGTVTRVNVTNNKVVSEGELLLEIDPTRYQAALDSAQAALDESGQAVGALGAGVQSAQARVVDARAALTRAQKDYDRLKRIQDEEPAAVSQASITKAESTLAQSKAQLGRAEADLLKAREQLGQKGEDNPKIRSAMAALAKARVDLDDTTMRAPSDGGITNLRVDVGHYAQAGQPLMTFVSATDVWVEGYMRENSIGNIKPADRVDIVLDVAPGRVFTGRVRSIGAGVDWGSSEQLGALPSVPSPKGWLRDPQRVPVVIEFSNDDAFGLRREGGQADVIVYTGDGWLFNGLGWLWIRIMSLISYVY